MTPQQFKKQFNLLYNNINNNAAPGLRDAEISMFLNKAQNEIVKSHVLGPTTTYQVGINQASKRDVELDSLIMTVDYVQDSSFSRKIHTDGSIWNITDTDYNPLVILSEIANDSLNVIELSYSEFNKFMSGVYKYPKKSQCWKIRHDGVFEIIPPNNKTVTSVKQVYVKIPTQIVINTATPSQEIACELPEVLHDEIVQRAVELAKAAYASEQLSVQMSMGKRSE